jgi:hypothetical protein
MLQGLLEPAAARAMKEVSGDLPVPGYTRSDMLRARSFNPAEAGMGVDQGPIPAFQPGEVISSGQRMSGVRLGLGGILVQTIPSDFFYLSLEKNTPRLTSGRISRTRESSADAPPATVILTAPPATATPVA